MIEENKIGTIISLKRKEKGITQQELGDLLGVSSKTISKWECGNSYPDITMIKDISRVLNVSIEDLLNGKISNQKVNDFPKISSKRILILSLFLIIIVLILISIVMNITPIINKSIQINPEKNCTVVKTFNIENIQNSNDENYIYVTITEYQNEGVYTIKLPVAVAQNIKENNHYIFTLKTTKENINVEINTLFSNSEIINIEHTDKIGMDSESSIYCDIEK